MLLSSIYLRSFPALENVFFQVVNVAPHSHRRKNFLTFAAVSGTHPQGSADETVASGPPPSGGPFGGRPLLSVPSGSGSGSGSGGFVSLNGVSMVLGGEETPRWGKAGGGEGGPDSSPRLDYLRAKSAATRYVRI